MKPYRANLIASTAAMLVLAACGGTSNSAQTGSNLPQSIGPNETALNLIAWTGYVESGKTDPKVDWVTPFTTATGCKINVKFADTSDEMVTLMRQGGGTQYDGVSASGDATNRLIAHGDVATQHGIVGECHDISHLAIMADVGTGHEKASVADLGDPAAIFGAGVHGDAFANSALSPDDEPRRAAAVSDRLRRRAERSKRIDRGLRSHGRVAGEVDVREQPASRSDRNLRPDDAIGTDLDVLGDFRGTLHACGWMNARHFFGHRSAIIAPSSASQAIRPFTLASPRNHHMFLRLALRCM